MESDSEFLLSDSVGCSVRHGWLPLAFPGLLLTDLPRSNDSMLYLSSRKEETSQAPESPSLCINLFPNVPCGFMSDRVVRQIAPAANAGGVSDRTASSASSVVSSPLFYCCR